ncbi:MAG: FxsA family protein [Pseudomonadota bacterium]
MALFAVFVAIPILEIALFIQVGGALGLWPTLAIVIATALAGTILVRQQGLSTLAELRSSLERGGDPTRSIAHGALILVAGVVLLTPGFFTDAVGLALMIPPVRSALIAAGARRLAAQVIVTRPQPRQGDAREETVIDGEFTVEEPEQPGRSGWTRRE